MDLFGFLTNSLLGLLGATLTDTVVAVARSNTATKGEDQPKQTFTFPVTVTV